MALDLSYSVWVQKTTIPHAYVSTIETKQITAFHDSKQPDDIDSEGRVGELFGKIKSHHSVTIFALPSQFSADSDFKNLLVAVPNKSTFMVTIYFFKNVTVSDGANPPHKV